MNSKQTQEQRLLQAALALESEDQREAFLRAACADDPALQGRLRELIALSAADSFSSKISLSTLGPAESAPSQTAPMDSSRDELCGERIGRYQLLEKLGEGGFGTVWLAEQKESVRRKVALKVIKLGMDTRQVVGRFEAERQALALMDHPHIAKVLDAGATETGRPFFVMELVRGIPITRYCDENNLPTVERLKLFIQVCQAIQHAHQKGIIHRDIKPSNILVTLHESVPVPKVIDFGIAKATQVQLTDVTIHTQLQQFVGTPAYMSPEQAELSGLDIDTRSDIYSLGVLLYELLVGKTPFDAKELMKSGLDQMRRTIREEEPVRPSTRLSGMVAEESTTTAKRRGSDVVRLIHVLRGDLDWIVMKALEKDRTRRYETASGLAADIRRYLENEPVLARPPGTGYRLYKAYRRNRLAFAAAGAVAAVLVLGVLVSTWLAIRATDAKREQIRQRLKADEALEIAQQQRRQADHARTVAQGRLYAARMNLTQKAWEENNTARVKQLLETTATDPERGFEWNYWQRQVHRESKTLRGHLGPVVGVAFSPDARRIVTASLDHSAMVWDPDQAKPLFTLNHLLEVRSAAFSPDGQLIVTASADRTATIWSASTGSPLRTLHGDASGFTAVDFSPDGTRILTGSFDGTARVWDANTGAVLFTLTGSSGAIWSASFSTDGRRMITSYGDESAQVWETSTGAHVFTLKGRQVQLGREEHFEAAIPFTAAFSPDGHWIATGNLDQTAVVWDPATIRPALTIQGPSPWVSPWQMEIPFRIAFSPDSYSLAMGSLDHNVSVRATDTGSLLFTLKGHDAEIAALAYSRDGRWLLTGSYDHTARIWDTMQAKQAPSLEGHTKDIIGAVLSPNGRQIATCSLDGTARLWDGQTGQALATFTAMGDEIWAVAFSPAGDRLGTGNLDQNGHVWDIASRKRLFALEGHTATVKGIAFSPDGSRIATGSDDHTARIWNATNGKGLFVLKGHTAGVPGVAFSPDGHRLITASEDGTAKMWDAHTGKEVFTITGHSGGIRAVAFSPDGQLVVTGSADNTARIWSAADGKELLKLSGHNGRVISVAFSPDGRRVITGSFDDTSKVWELADGQEVLTFEGFPCLLSPDGGRLVTFSFVRRATILEIASAEQLKRWRAEEEAAAQYLAERKRQQATALPAPEVPP